MDVCENDEKLVMAVLTNTEHRTIKSYCGNVLGSQQTLQTENVSNNQNSAEKHSAIWTINSTSTLLRLYESKLEMLETPKKKTRIWQAISEDLKNYNIEMSPDQVRWKINALTKKYKQSIDSGQHDKFRYFKEMDSIYTHYNVDCDSYTITELLLKKKYFNKSEDTGNSVSVSTNESKTMIELRKIRLANRIESDRNQGKIHLERQWLEYLKSKEEEKLYCDNLYEQNLKFRQEELELRKRKLEFEETLAYKRIELMEKEYDYKLQIEREKCELLKQLT